MKTVRFGIIGCGLMGREFASAAARWCHLLGQPAKPEIVAVCNRSSGPFEWFRQNFPGIQSYSSDYREMLQNPNVDAIYVAVPHHLHQEICCAAIESGRHLMIEKPAGIDRAANQKIMAALSQNPAVFARCASQWIFYPPAQRIGQLIDRGALGQLLEVNAGFLHSSDLDPKKPINWKRMVEFNGEYGVMGDLGMHVCALPFRAGWIPLNVRAILSNIVKTRPDGKGGDVPCSTWDNATLFCEAKDSRGSDSFPMTLKMQRIAPGQRNSWYIEALGTRGSIRYSTRAPKSLEWLEYAGGDQVWGQVETGYESAFKTISGSIFEFGFPDSILQMWASFMSELTQGPSPQRFVNCVTPAEVALSHRLFTAALESHKSQSVQGV